MGAGGSLSVLLAIRYYSLIRYPILKKFEGYYIEKLELDAQNLDKVKIWLAQPKEPRSFTIPLEKFKQLHHLNHKCETDLEKHVPFKILEAGFDDNKFE